MKYWLHPKPKPKRPNGNEENAKKFEIERQLLAALTNINIQLAEVSSVQQSEVIPTGPRNPDQHPLPFKLHPFLHHKQTKALLNCKQSICQQKKKQLNALCIKDANVTMYTEDTSVENRIKTVEDTQTSLIPNLSNVCDWLKADKLISQIHGSQRNFGPSCGMKI